MAIKRKGDKDVTLPSTHPLPIMSVSRLTLRVSKGKTGSGIKWGLLFLPFFPLIF